METNYQKLLRLFSLRAASITIDANGVATVNDPGSNLNITFVKEKTPCIVQGNLLDKRYVKLNLLYDMMSVMMSDFSGVKEMYRHTTTDTLLFSIPIRGELMNAVFKEFQ